ERALTGAIIPNLQTGELADDSGGLPKAAPEPPVPAIQARATDDAGLAAEVAAAPGLRADMAAVGRRDARLCELLGASGNAPRLGQGQALGLCSGAAVALAPAAGTDRTGAAPPKTRVGPAQAAGSARPAKDAASVRTAAPVKAESRKAAAAPRAAPAAMGMIPADARFVQVGTCADPAEAEGAIRRLGRLGLPVARARQSQGGRPVQIIMARPFDSRQAVVRTLDRVRKAGFAQARTRR
ncbi:MAG TPA: SPOR domain-containing protein, partial [Paracoccus sp. (in: a-proteobacteria)]|nr:SPOR domain-containing protein [Paracoccus sp. (in: a-proteobacteria)]